MSESALDRTSRALDLVPFLLEHQGISISELAETFGVSEEQINKDLMLIHMCGLPGYTPLELIDMYYEDGYVTVSEPQSLRAPRRMNRHEMAAILVGLDLLKSSRSDQLANEISALQEKLRGDFEIENPFVVVHEEVVDNFVTLIESAISKSIAVRIQYLSGNKDEKSARNILPIELYTQNNRSYLIAWCEKSQGDRTFRLDRIVECELLPGIEIRATSHSAGQDPKEGSIVLLVDQSARSFIEENRAIISKASKIGERWEVYLSEIEEEWLIRTALGYGKAIEVVSPLRVAEEISKRTSLILGRYKAK